MVSKPAVRKFAVEPVETTSRSSNSSSTSRKTNDDSIDATTSSGPTNPSEQRKPRRFAPQVVETTQKSSREGVKNGQPDKPRARRFAPEVIEHSGTPGKTKAPVKKFVPEIMETQYNSNRSSLSDSEKRPPRKFEPVLIDTAARSRRTTGSTSSGARTEEGFLLHAREHRRHITGTKTPRSPPPEQSTDELQTNERTLLAPSGHFDLPSEPKRNVAPLDGRSPLHTKSTSHRNHSFRLPELDTIASSESSECDSARSSMSCSPDRGSPFTISDSSFQAYHDATRRRESIEPEFATYLLALEAKRAQQKLQEEALLAAFPNAGPHEPVQHYMDNDDDSEEFEIEDRPVTFGPDDDLYIEMKRRRESTANISWEQLEMQRHAEKLKQEANANKITARQTSESPWWKPGPIQNEGPPGAKPPMLGNDIIFPRCPSPEPARFDVTQGSAALRAQMCNSSQDSTDQKSKEVVGLWQGKSKVQPGPAVMIDTPPPSASATPKGLWGGFCVTTDGQGTGPIASGHMGLLTPMADRDDNPFEQAFAAPKHLNAEFAHLRTPDENGPKSAPVSHINAVLEKERRLDEIMAEEFSDSFVTQVYNYLSLGYPSLARPFDEELSKISGMTIAELREDDKKAKQTPRGYIRLGDDFEGGGMSQSENVEAQSCKRWRGLKRYIAEWARQEHEGIINDGGTVGIGVAVRRGSWGI